MALGGGNIKLKLHECTIVSENVMPFLRGADKRRTSTPGCRQPEPNRVGLVVFHVKKKQGKVCYCYTPSITHPPAKGYGTNMDTKAGFLFSFGAFCVCMCASCTSTLCVCVITCPWNEHTQKTTPHTQIHSLDVRLDYAYNLCFSLPFYSISITFLLSVTLGMTQRSIALNVYPVSLSTESRHFHLLL